MITTWALANTSVMSISYVLSSFLQVSSHWQPLGWTFYSFLQDVEKYLWERSFGKGERDSQGAISNTCRSHIPVSVPRHPRCVLPMQSLNPHLHLPLPCKALSVALIQSPNSSSCFRYSTLIPLSSSQNGLPIKQLPPGHSTEVLPFVSE